MKGRLFQIWFSLRCGVANREFMPLLERYGSPYEIFMADEAEVDRMPCSDNLKRALNDKSLAESNRILDYCRQNGVGFLFWQDDNYPQSLRVLRDPPVLLYYKGVLPDFANLLCIGVVGTRTMSEYGKTMAYKLGYELAASKTVVVSGMALGIDSMAAAGALCAGGTTVAVLGSGIDYLYPYEHKNLAKVIQEHGIILTEYPPATEPRGANFPVRNRIISGLSQGVVVVEADRRSGALITARNAINQGKIIYAVPGNVGDTNSSGTNQLIMDGAAVILCARDILADFQFLYRDVLDNVGLALAERRSEPDDATIARLGVYVRTENGAMRKSKYNHTSTERTSGERAPSTPSPSSSRKQSPPADTEGRQQPTPPPPPAPSDPKETSPGEGDRSEKILRGLTETQRGIFAALPLDHAVPVDYLTREGFTMSEIMAAMTILEIKGLVVSLPGGLFSRK